MTSPRSPIAKRHRGIAEVRALDLIPSALARAVIAAGRMNELVPKLTKVEGFQVRAAVAVLTEAEGD